VCDLLSTSFPVLFVDFAEWQYAILIYPLSIHSNIVVIDDITHIHHSGYFNFMYTNRVYLNICIRLQF